MGKRGQFTVFVILGIVIILAFAFLFFIRSILVTDQLEAQADRLFDEFVQTSSVNTYVSSCLTEIFEDSLVTLSSQGGVIYDHQNGTIPVGTLEGRDHLPLDGVNITYGLLPNTECSLVQQIPPSYPRPFTNLDELPTSYYESLCRFTDLTSGFFGTNNLTKLCAHDGTNRLDAESSPLQRRTCETGTYNLPGESSIQDQLQDFLQDQLPRCVNLGTFLDRYNTNITPLGEPNVSVTWGDGSVTVKATYPLRMVVDGVPISTVQEFSTPLEWDVKNLYNFVFFLLAKDASDPYFSIEDHYATIRFYRTAYHVEVIRNPCRACQEGVFDDVLVVEDHSILVKGDPLRFQVAIQNRRPALEWLPKPRYTADNDLDILTLENRSIELKPLGLDPDDTRVWYNYSGWKETHNETFDFERAEAGGCTEQYFADCVLTEPGEPRNWSESDWFQADGRTARYRTNRKDSGYHEVNITVWDEKGLIDFQRVHILVFDLPRAELNGTNPYDDVSGRNASLEDPFFLNGSQSNASIVGGGSEEDIVKFLWNDTDEPFSNWTTEPFVWIPFAGNYEDMDIITIREQPFTLLRTHQVLLEVVEDIQGLEVLSAPATLDVDVRACLPHRDTSPSFPYEEDDRKDDPFQANHTCCTDDFRVRTNGICFSEVTFGSIFAIQDHQDDYLLPGGLFDLTDLVLPGGVSTYEQVAEHSRNDIFRRSFSRTCSGDRGNICSGPGTDTIVLEEACSDAMPAGGERCEGPPVGTISGTAPSCEQYGPGETFERIFEEGTGYCGPATQSTLSSYGDVTGNFQCQGYCDGTGGCGIPVNCVCEMPGSHACDGIPETNLPTTVPGCARGGASYFQDACATTCELGDSDTICRSSDFHATCTADAACNGVEAGTCIGPNRRCTETCTLDAYNPSC